MCRECKQVKSLVLFEGQVRWIMERETPEERLAAWETLTAIAFPNPYELPYEPPQIPIDGSPMSPCDRVRRDTYYMFSDIIKCQYWEQFGSIKNRKKVAAGMLGAAVRYGKMESTAEEPFQESNDFMPQEQEQPKPVQVESKYPTLTPRDEMAEETPYFSEKFLKIRHLLTEYDKKKIDEWNKKIPNAAALKEWLDRNYFQTNKRFVCSDTFCEYAYQRLAREDNWCSYKTRHVMNNLANAIHWMAIDFQRKSNEIRRAEEEEHRKDVESDFATKTMVVSQQTNEDIADMQRISSRKAEREAMEKILRGEL